MSLQIPYENALWSHLLGREEVKKKPSSPSLSSPRNEEKIFYGDESRALWKSQRARAPEISLFIAVTVGFHLKEYSLLLVILRDRGRDLEGQPSVWAFRVPLRKNKPPTKGKRAPVQATGLQLQVYHNYSDFLSNLNTGMKPFPAYKKKSVLLRTVVSKPKFT